MFKFSFKMKTILGIALIEAVFLFILVLQSRSVLYETIELDIKERAHNISSLLATASVNAVVAQDLATLESIVDSGMTTSGIIYIKIRGLDSVLVERGEQSVLDRKFKADSSIAESENDQIFDKDTGIFIDDYRLGSVEIGLSVTKQKIIIKNATNNLTTIALIELIFVGVFSLLLGIALTKRLILLQEAAVKMSQGETGLQIPLKGNDEVTDASRAFNLMSTKIGEVTQALISDNARMDAIMNTATDAIFMISPDGMIHSVNQATYIMFGYEEKDIIGQSLFTFMPDLHLRDMVSSTERYIQRIDGVTFKGKNVSLEVHSNDMTFDNQQYIVGVIRDLTAINKLQHELEAVFNLSQSAFLILTHDNKISYVNPAFYSMFSTISADCYNCTINWDCLTYFIKALLDPAHHTDLRILDELSINSKLYLIEPEEKILKVSRQHIEATNPYSSDIFIFDDITHETLIDRMKSEFLTTAAHELRTPLASVMGYSELLVIRDFSPEQTKDIAGSINRQSIRLKQIVDDLLEIASIENRTIESLDMVQDTLEVALTESCEDISGNDRFHCIYLQKPTYWPTVEFDASRIRQIIANILSNAYKYSPTSPTVKVSTTMRITEETSEFGVIVEDSGIGMTPEQLSHVGERFYRADSISGNIPGTGLGISIIKELIMRHKGRLEIESTLGEGTTVIFWLPIILTNHTKD